MHSRVRSIRSAIRGLVPRAWFTVGRSFDLTGQIITLPMVYGGFKVAGPLLLVQPGDGADQSLGA